LAIEPGNTSEQQTSNGVDGTASVVRRFDGKTWLKIIFFVFILAWFIISGLFGLLKWVAGTIGAIGLSWAILGPIAMLIGLYSLRETSPFESMMKERTDGSWEPTGVGSIILGVAFGAGVLVFLVGIGRQIQLWARRRSSVASM
jgi:hypothetical protein